MKTKKTYKQLHHIKKMYELRITFYPDLLGQILAIENDNLIVEYRNIYRIHYNEPGEVIKDNSIEYVKMNKDLIRDIKLSKILK